MKILPLTLIVAFLLAPVSLITSTQALAGGIVNQCWPPLPRVFVNGKCVRHCDPNYAQRLAEYYECLSRQRGQ